MSSSASAAGLRGGSASGTRRRGRKRNASGDDKTSSWPPPRSYRAALSVTRRSVALTRAVQAVDFGNIAAALTELDRALAEHAAAGGSGEERREGREGSDGSEAGGRWTSPLPSGTGEEDVRICTFSCCSFVSFPSALLEVARSETENGTQKKKTSKRKKKKKLKKKKQMRRLYVLHLQNSEDLFSPPEELRPLRSLLRLSEEEAREVEDEVLSASGGFSI